MLTLASIILHKLLVIFIDYIKEVDAGSVSKKVKAVQMCPTFAFFVMASRGQFYWLLNSLRF